MVVVEVVVVVNGKVRNPAEVTPEVEKQNERKRVNDEQFLKLLKMAPLFLCLHQSVWLLCYVFSCCLDNPIPFPVALNPMWSMLKLWLVFSEKDNFLITEQFSSRLSIQMHVLFLIHFIKIIVFHSSANSTSTSDMNFVCYCNKKENIPFPTQDFIGVPVNFSG